MDVEEILNQTLSHEGGFSNNPKDHGGPTKYGITQATLSLWLRHPASIEDVKNLDLETAKEIYRTNYLYHPRINTLPEEIVPQVFDISVNSGPVTAVKLLQRVLNDSGFGPISVDGVLGPESRSAAELAQTQMGDFLTNALVIEREKFYQMIALNDPSQEIFLAGWISRAESFKIGRPVIV